MKVLLILVDGMRPDALADLPIAQKVLKKSAYNLNAQTVFPSVTLPCHMSLFYSVPPERHGTTNNDFTPWVRPMDGLMETLRAKEKKCAMFYDWWALRNVARPNATSYCHFASGMKLGRYESCEMNTAAALTFLPKYHTDFAFLYYGVPDHMGHEHGWMGEEYMKSVRFCWDQIDQVLEALGDEYTVIITADHGGHARTHGTTMPEDMIIPLMILGKDIQPGEAFADANLMDIAPTVAKLLGVDPNPEWEGKSLL